MLNNFISPWPSYINQGHLLLFISQLFRMGENLARCGAETFTQPQAGAKMSRERRLLKVELEGFAAGIFWPLQLTHLGMSPLCI